MDTDHDTLMVSVLICSKGRRKRLENLVEKLINSNAPCRYEIVVVEETNYPKPIEGVKYVGHPVANKGIPYARNLALKSAVGEIVIFLDDDCMIQDNWMAELLKPFSNASVVGVQGGVTVPESTNAIGWAESILGFPGGGITRILRAKGENGLTREISTLNCAYRKWVIDRIGGFDQRLVLGGEDYKLAKRACEFGECLFIPSAEVRHEPRGTLMNNYIWFFKRGRAELALSRTGWRSREFYRYWLQSSLLLKILLVVYTAVLAGIPVGSLIILLPFYCAGIVFKRLRPLLSSRIPLTAMFILPLVKMVMDIGIDCGRLSETARVFSRAMLNPKQRRHLHGA